MRRSSPALKDGMRRLVFVAAASLSCVCCSRTEPIERLTRLPAEADAGARTPADRADSAPSDDSGTAEEVPPMVQDAGGATYGRHQPRTGTARDAGARADAQTPDAEAPDAPDAPDATERDASESPAPDASIECICPSTEAIIYDTWAASASD